MYCGQIYLKTIQFRIKYLRGCQQIIFFFFSYQPEKKNNKDIVLIGTEIKKWNDVSL